MTVVSLKTALLSRGINSQVEEKDQEKIDQGVGNIEIGIPIGILRTNRKEEKIAQDLVVDLVIATLLEEATKPGTSKSSTVTMVRGLVRCRIVSRRLLMTLTQEGTIASCKS